MVQSFLNTGTQGANFEDLVNFITKISPEATQFMSAIGTTKAKAIVHSWPTQTLRAGAANAGAEGFTPSFAAGNVSVRVKRNNNCQILKQEFSVSATQDAIDKAGLGQGSEYDNQKMLKYKEIAKDCDFVLLQNTATTRDADAGTAGQMDGALAWVPASNAKDGTGTIITQDLANQMTQAIWENSGETADTFVCAGFQRGQISKWTLNFKEHQLPNTTLTDTIEVYKGDWGTQKIVPDLQMVTNQILAYRGEYLKKAFLRAPFHEELGKTIDGRRGFVAMELTLEAQNPNSLGRVYGLNVA